MSAFWANNVDLNLYIFFLEVDALTIVKALKNGPFHHAAFGHLLLDIYRLISLFSGILVNHVYYEDNTSTHGLTKFALKLNVNWVWWEELFLSIESVIINNILSWWDLIFSQKKTKNYNFGVFWRMPMNLKNSTHTFFFLF